MPDSSSSDADFQESQTDKQNNDETASALDWRRVTFRLSDEVEFGSIVADRWDSEKRQPAELKSILSRPTVGERLEAENQEIDRLRKEPYTFTAPLRHVCATGHYIDTHTSESTLNLSQLSLKEYADESLPDFSEVILRLENLQVTIDECEPGTEISHIWRDEDDGTFHLSVGVDNKTMQALSESFQITDHSIELTLQLKGRHKSKSFYEDMYFWLAEEKGNYRNYGDIELTNISIGKHGGVSREDWRLPATNSIAEARSKLAEYKAGLKRHGRLQHIKKFWWAYLAGVAVARYTAYLMIGI